MGQADHLDFFIIAKARCFHVRSHNAVEQTSGWKVLHARKADFFDLLKKIRHYTERISAVDTSQHRRVLDDGQHLVRHLHDDSIGVTVGEQPGQRTATSHPVAA